jgi:hypothetical protein
MMSELATMKIKGALYFLCHSFGNSTYYFICITTLSFHKAIKSIIPDPYQQVRKPLLNQIALLIIQTIDQIKYDTLPKR